MQVKIEIQDQEVRRALNGLIALSKDLSPAMREIGLNPCPDEEGIKTDRGGHDRLFVARYADLDAVAVVRDDKYGWLTWTFYASHKDIDHRRAGHLLYVREGD